MRLKVTILAILLVLLTPATHSNQAGEKMVVKEDKSNNLEAEISARKFDKEAEILSHYLAQYNSPLQYHAQDFIDAARAYNLDWKLVPSIAGVESTFGKFIPGGYNGWGWGVYGTQAIYFNSWKEAIYNISKGLKEDYIDEGLKDPYSINRKYAASPFWGGNVSYFMKELEQFALDYQKNQISLSGSNSMPRIAAVSGTLVLR